MKIPSVPPRHEPPRVSNLDDLRRFKVALRTCVMCRGVYSHELTLADGFVSSHAEYDGVSRDDKLSFQHADVILRGFVFYAVRGASREF